MSHQPLGPLIVLDATVIIALQPAATHAFRDEHDQWHGEPGLLPAARYQEAPSFIRFSRANINDALHGQILTVRYGGVPEEHSVTAYTVQIRLRDGSPCSLRVTRAVQGTLFGFAHRRQSERAEWEAARDRRASERESRRWPSRPRER